MTDETTTIDLTGTGIDAPPTDGNPWACRLEYLLGVTDDYDVDAVEGMLNAHAAVLTASTAEIDAEGAPTDRAVAVVVTAAMYGEDSVHAAKVAYAGLGELLRTRDDVEAFSADDAEPIAEVVDSDLGVELTFEVDDD